MHSSDEASLTRDYEVVFHGINQRSSRRSSNQRGQERSSNSIDCTEDVKQPDPQSLGVQLEAIEREISELYGVVGELRNKLAPVSIASADCPEKLLACPSYGAVYTTGAATQASRIHELRGDVIGIIDALRL